MKFHLILPIKVGKVSERFEFCIPIFLPFANLKELVYERSDARLLRTAVEFDASLHADWLRPVAFHIFTRHRSRFTVNSQNQLFAGNRKENVNDDACVERQPPRFVT